VRTLTDGVVHIDRCSALIGMQGRAIMTDLLQPIMTRYANFAMTTDGVPEINTLTYASFETEYADADANARFALVLIEPRLLNATGNAGLRAQLLARLQRFKGDLRAEGLQSRFLLADLYRGAIQKDGRIVLALRRFLRDVKGAFANFEGVVLVGDFPDSTLARRVSWTPGFVNPRRLWINLEMISERADIVLADLTGNWEALYQQAPFDAENISAAPNAATDAAGWFDGESVRNCIFTSTDFTIDRGSALRDAFYMDDALYTILAHTTSPPLLQLQLRQAERNNEVDITDRTLTNIIARPDISVSRVNSRHVSVNPNPGLHGSSGQTFLDAAGNPQTVPSPTPLYGSDADLFNFYDFDLERRLLIDYFDRSHRFRTGAFAYLPFRGAVISGTTDFSPDSYEGLINAAASDFGPCLKTPDASLLQYAQFHKTPAVFKYIMAHSDATHSEFRDTYAPADLTTEAGGPPVRWVYGSGQYTPTFTGLGGTADLYVHRALWQRGTLANAGASLMIHGGCNVNSVPDSQGMTYTAPNYGWWNNAEGVLFFTNCVALFSRAKGFNDAPDGFADGYRTSDRANFGSCWRTYFNTQSSDSGLSTYNIQRKRAYFWSISGDWTVRLRNRNGLGIIGLNPVLGSIAVHPNRAWIDGWNFDAAVNHIAGLGDMDADGLDELVVTSDWGVGVLKYTGTHFRALMIAARDTWFGGWRWDATVNTGRDSIKTVARFTGTAASQFMVWSSWGMATLQYNGSSLFPTRIFSNGTRLGGWLLSTADNSYRGSGRFESAARSDMIVTSPWGVGLISLERSTHLFMAPTGARFGGWSFDVTATTVRLIADFDGDGLDEILVSSSWGIGILKMSGGALTSIAMHADGDDLGGYPVRHSDNFLVADNLRGSSQRDVVVTNAAGIHVLTLGNNGRLARMNFWANGTRVDGWMLDTNQNQIQRAGDMNADGRAEMTIRSPWGLGIIGLDASGVFRCYGLFAYGSVLNDWILESGDLIAGSGNPTGAPGRAEMVFLKP
jgi:hypothetical protein